jgi:Fungal protein of unknown function (DUF2011)
MFEELEAKRIRRSDIFNDADSGSEELHEDAIATDDNDEGAAATPAYHFDYDLLENDSGKVTQFAHLRVHQPTQENEAADERQEEEAFEFRLFSAPAALKTEDESKTPKSAPSKINIRSPTPDQQSDGRFVNPHRPLTYYFTPSGDNSNFSLAAVSSDDVLTLSQSPWPGTQLPWRVIHLPSSKVSMTDVSSHAKSMLKVKGPDSANRRKGKPSKKRRILLRTRAKRVIDKAKEKEDHLREKKTRLNREKKIKRKAKEKAEKAKLAGAGQHEGASL